MAPQRRPGQLRLEPRPVEQRLQRERNGVDVIRQAKHEPTWPRHANWHGTWRIERVTSGRQRRRRRDQVERRIRLGGDLEVRLFDDALRWKMEDQKRWCMWALPNETRIVMRAGIQAQVARLDTQRKKVVRPEQIDNHRSGSVRLRWRTLHHVIQFGSHRWYI